jgi:hypothetical protein
MSSIENFTLYNDRGQSVRMANLLDWRDPLNPDNDVFGPVCAYSWTIKGTRHELVDKAGSLCLRELPYASGFICLERQHIPNNCTLLDAYGKERMRLTVPWQLTTANDPASNAPPTSFWGVSEPYINPVDGKQGEFGVKAWVELAGEYYFELDWRTGNFLWGKEIRF